MRKIVVADYQEASRVGAALIARQIWDKPNSVLGLATGSTPVGLYKALISMHRSGALDFSKVTTFNLDEYHPIQKTNEQSYDAFMRQNLFDHVNIHTYHIPNGAAADPEAECAAYEAAIAAAGGLDLQLLGIGLNGHIGFNEPAAELNAATHRTDLTESTVKANARFFEDESEVPRQALTMGVGTILRARKILLLITGEAKRPIARKLFSGVVTTSAPATLLALHPDVTVVMDEAAV